jgi:pimeloyl-ACP methyl ester carboxylesterase
MEHRECVMRRASSFVAFTAGLTAVGATLGFARFRRELSALEARLRANGTLATTASGLVEYADTGHGRPLLAIHGAGGGYDQGVLVAGNIGAGFRIIAPSRFGYLRTPVPKDFSPAAQADAHAALLDFLHVERCIVLAASAGAPSAIELALRYPDRVSALILLVPRTYHPSQAIGADRSMPSQTVLRLIESSADFLFWVAMRVRRGSIVRFLGVPPAVEAAASDEDRAQVTDVINSIRPLSMRVRGIELDSQSEMSPWPLEQIAVPTLIVSAEDDLFNTLPGARYTAEQIRGSELRVLPSGGHLMVGQGALVRRWIRDFLERHQARLEPGVGEAQPVAHTKAEASGRMASVARRDHRRRRG